MAFELSVRAERLLQQNTKEPTIILEIDGFDEIFGAIDVTELVRIGSPGVEIGNFIIGGIKVHENSKPYISFKGSSSKIKQQIFQDKGGTSSISRLNLKMIDKNKELTKLFQPGHIVDDIIGRRCRIYVGFKGGAHPEDSINLFNGFVDDTKFGAGFLTFVIGHPDALRRQDIFEKQESILTSAMDISQTTLTVDDTEGFLLAGDILTTHVRVGNEIIQYTGISGNQLTGLTRGVFVAKDPLTAANSHDTGSKVKSFYRLQDSAISMALKIMLSTDNKYYVNDLSIQSYVQLDPVTIAQNAIFFQGIDIATRYGTVVGDFVSTTGSINPANDISNKTIIGIFKTTIGSYIVVDSSVSLIAETNSTAIITLKSKYDTLPVGSSMNMLPQDVDINQHEELIELLSTAIPSYDFYLKKTKKAKKFIDQEIYYPAGMFQVPRKGKTSVNTNLPPLAIRGVVTFDENAIQNPASLVIERSAAENFYNKVIYEYDENILDDDTQYEKKLKSDESVARIKVGNRPLTIVSKGMRKTIANDNAIDIINRRLLERYQFAAEKLSNVKIKFKEGLKVEVSDGVIFGSPAMQISDSTSGDRKFKPRIMEIQNKVTSMDNGDQTFDIVDTAFGLETRFGVISPASLIDAGSSSTNLYLKRSFGTTDIELEQEKWERYIGETILIHNEDFSFQEEVVLKTFLQSQNDVMIIEPALSMSPQEDWTIEAPNYSGDSDTKFTWKNLNAYLTPQVSVVSGVNNFKFNVGASDISKFFVGSVIRVHNETFTVDSTDKIIKITEINALEITVDKTLGFTPTSSELIDLIGFDSDEGRPYSYI